MRAGIYIPTEEGSILPEVLWARAARLRFYRLGVTCSICERCVVIGASDRYVHGWFSSVLDHSHN